MSKPKLYLIPESARREPKPQPFAVGDKVRKIDAPWIEGIVGNVPDGPVVALGSHVIGNEIRVDLPDGSCAVSDPDQWESVE